MPQGNAVKFISAPLKVTNTQRGGQQTQQYSGQPSGFAARPQTYTSGKSFLSNHETISFAGKFDKIFIVL